MTTTREELKSVKNNVMTIMENRVMMMTGCNRTTANLVANEVLSLDSDAEFILNNPEKEDHCNSCVHYINDRCNLEGEGCQTEIYECYENK